MSQPVIHFQSSTFPGYNLFLLFELSGATATLLGNVLALIGATSTNNQFTINALGITFAILNVTFASAFFVLFYMDTKRLEKERNALLAVDVRSLNDDFGAAIKGALEEWDQIMIEAQKAEREAEKKLVMAAMNIKYVRTHLATAVERGLIKLEKKWACEDFEEVESETIGELRALIEAYGEVLNRANKECYETISTPFAHASKALLKSFPNLIMEKKLKFCEKVAEWTGETASNPLAVTTDGAGGGIELAPIVAKALV